MTIVNYDRIRELSLKKFRSIERAGHVYGLTKQTFYNYLNDKKGIDLDLLIKISNLLKCGINDLLNERIDFDKPYNTIQNEPLRVCETESLNYKNVAETFITQNRKISELEAKLKECESQLEKCRQDLSGQNTPKSKPA